jgi:hypothetical protein
MQPKFRNSVPTDTEFNNLFHSEEACLEYLFNAEVFYSKVSCPNCKCEMCLYRERCEWRCTRNACGGCSSIRTGTFFAFSKLPCIKILELGRRWLNRDSCSSIIRSSGCSSKTVSAYNGYFRRLVADSLEFEDYTIGGKNIIVEIDECKISKRKYNRGHPVEGAWVLGGVERTKERGVFLVEVPDRSAITLLSLLEKHILPGSIVYSDMWKGYSQIENLLGFKHQTLNHSKEFISIKEIEYDDYVVVEKVHTNTIEGTWSGLKLCIPKRNRTKDVEAHLWEFIWRRKNANRLWDGLISSLREVLYE